MADVARVKVRLPSGKLVFREKWVKPSMAKCAVCGKPLQGVPRLRKAELKKLPKSKKRPSRPYGGYLCSRCMRETFRDKTRKISES